MNAAYEDYDIDLEYQKLNYSIQQDFDHIELRLECMDLISNLEKKPKNIYTLVNYSKNHPDIAQCLEDNLLSVEAVIQSRANFKKYRGGVTGAIGTLFRGVFNFISSIANKLNEFMARTLHMNSKTVQKIKSLYNVVKGVSAKPIKVNQEWMRKVKEKFPVFIHMDKNTLRADTLGRFHNTPTMHSFTTIITAIMNQPTGNNIVFDKEVSPAMLNRAMVDATGKFNKELNDFKNYFNKLNTIPQVIILPVYINGGKVRAFAIDNVDGNSYFDYGNIKFKDKYYDLNKLNYKFYPELKLGTHIASWIDHILKNNEKSDVLGENIGMFVDALADVLKELEKKCKADQGYNMKYVKAFTRLVVSCRTKLIVDRVKCIVDFNKFMYKFLNDLTSEATGKEINVEKQEKEEDI